MIDDSEFLRRYASEGAEDAFAEVVRRHLPFVYAAALRQVGGDNSLAQDVAQTVFTDLARKSAELAHHRALVGWLFTSTRFAAANAVRGEQRRRAHEHEAHTMREFDHEPAASADWAELRPVIDAVLESLATADRDAVLLRFFEGRTFSDIGTQLSITSDAARLRIERALEKMRTALARHGVKSTTAALALALANQPVVAVPAALAAIVMSTALGAAAGGGLVASVGISTLMSTTKTLGWGVAAAVLLASLTGNTYFLTQRTRTESSLPSSVAKDVPPTAPKLPASATATVVPPPLATSVELTALRDELRAKGVSEEQVRAMVQGIARWRGRQAVSAQTFERAGRGWWRDEFLTRGMTDLATADDSYIYRNVVMLPVERLLGADPIDAAVAESRYLFLPTELREALGKLDRATVQLVPSRTGDPEADAASVADVVQQRRALDEKRRALLETFTPEQRTEWEMHLSPFALTLGRQLEPAALTETEFRTVYPLADGYAKALAEKPAEGIDVTARRAELQQGLVQKLVATLGAERAFDTLWAGTPEYSAVSRAARDSNLPASTAVGFTQLAVATGETAAKIQADPELSPDQKRSALLELQQRTRPALDALLSPALQRNLVPAATVWFTALGSGSFKRLTPSLFVTGPAGMQILSPPAAGSATTSRPQAVLPPASVNR